jgi:hypothetical protein
MNQISIRVTDMQAEEIQNRLFTITNGDIHTEEMLREHGLDMNDAQRILDNAPERAGVWFISSDDYPFCFDMVENILDQHFCPLDSSQPGAYRSMANLIKKMEAHTQ